MEAYVSVPTALLILAGLIFFAFGRSSKTKNAWFQFADTEKPRLTWIGAILFFLGLFAFFCAFGVQVIYPLVEQKQVPPVLTSGEETPLPTSEQTSGNTLPTIPPNATPTPRTNAWTEVIQDLITGSIEPSAGEFLASFFDAVNGARTRDELVAQWDSLSYEFQQASSKGNRNSFLDFWFSVRVSYVLQQCSRNVVDIRVTYFNRQDEARLNPGSQDFLRYTFEVRSGKWVIVNGVRLSEDARFCEGY